MSHLLRSHWVWLFAILACLLLLMLLVHVPHLLPHVLTYKFRLPVVAHQFRLSTTILN